MAGVAELLRHCLERGLTFVAFRWNGTVHVWVQRTPFLVGLKAEDLKDAGCGFVVAPFHDPNGQIYLLRPDVQLRPEGSQLDLSELGSCEGDLVLAGSPNEAWNENGHANAVREAQRAMLRGGLRKVVLARTIAMDRNGVDLSDLFIRALAAHPHAFVCLLNAQGLGTWLGATPERLLHATNDQVVIDAIAGTMPVDEAPNQNDQWGAKERDEQELVTQAIKNVCADQQLTGVRVIGPEVMKAGPVAHLHTRIEARTPTTELAALAAALHPTPAVCGTPREVARAFIRSHEPHDRRLYAGYWGPWQMDGRSDLFVNIRCLQAFRDRVDIHVGGGITMGSDAEHEWRETEQKARTWSELIGALGGRIT